MIKNKKILVVDDEIGIRELMTDILSDEGYTLVEARNGLEAINLYQQALQKKQPFDLVLLDVWMPEMDGIKVLEYWKKQVQEQQLPLMPLIIVMSGHAHEDIVKQILELGALQFIEKPITLYKLISVVHGILSKHPNYQAVLLEKAGFEINENVRVSYAVNPNDPTHSPIRIKKILTSQINNFNKEKTANPHKSEESYNQSVDSSNLINDGQHENIDLQNIQEKQGQQGQQVIYSNYGNNHCSFNNFADFVDFNKTGKEILSTHPLAKTLMEIDANTWHRFQNNYQKALQKEEYHVYYFFYKHYQQQYDVLYKEKNIEQVISVLNEKILFEFMMKLPDMMKLSLREARDDFERLYFNFLLQTTKHNITEVAELSQMERTHLYRKFRNLGIFHQKKQGSNNSDDSDSHGTQNHSNNDNIDIDIDIDIDHENH